jgi:hypothetical protein
VFVVNKDLKKRSAKRQTGRQTDDMMHMKLTIAAEDKQNKRRHILRERPEKWVL